MFRNFDYFFPVLVACLKGSVRTLSNLAAARIRTYNIMKNLRRKKNIYIINFFKNKKITREVGLLSKILMGNTAHAQFPLKMQKLVEVLSKLAVDCQ